MGLIRFDFLIVDFGVEHNISIVDVMSEIDVRIIS